MNAIWGVGERPNHGYRTISHIHSCIKQVWRMAAANNNNQRIWFRHSALLRSMFSGHVSCEEYSHTHQFILISKDCIYDCRPISHMISIYWIADKKEQFVYFVCRVSRFENRYATTVNVNVNQMIHFHVAFSFQCWLEYPKACTMLTENQYIDCNCRIRRFYWRI